MYVNTNKKLNYVRPRINKKNNYNNYKRLYVISKFKYSGEFLTRDIKIKKKRKRIRYDRK